MRERNALKIIKAVAPIRICDNGGWTDTWFAKYGRIFNIAVYPYAEVQITVYRRDDRPRITIHAENYGERYSVEGIERGHYGKHPLLEAAIEHMNVPDNVAFEVNIYSEAPVACSTGTSAAVSVALIGALDRLTPGIMTPYEVARTAQRIETECLRQQCGVQDQLASAYGGINYIEMHEYPHAVVTPVTVPNTIWWELESRLVLIYLGQAHSSTRVHEMVIKELAGAGPECGKLNALRQTAGKSREALLAGDFAALGRAMVANTEAQITLHPELAGRGHRAVIDIARRHGATGWKINGAGGTGGSVTILCGPDATEKRTMIAALEGAGAGYRQIPIYLSRFGLRVWEA